MSQLTPNATPSPAASTPAAALAALPVPDPAWQPELLRTMPATALPPLAPLPSADPNSPNAVGYALFCAVFNVAFATLTAWLAALPQNLIAQVRQTVLSPSPSPSPSQSPFTPHSPPSPSPQVSQSPSPQVSQSPSRPAPAPLSLPERILLACRCFYRLLCVYHTFRSSHILVTPRQLGLLGCAARAIERFSGRKFDFSCWRDCAGPRPKPYVWPDEQPSPSQSEIESPSQSPSIPHSDSCLLTPDSSLPQSQISNFKSQISSSSQPSFFALLACKWPFTAADAYNCPILPSPGSALAQVCRDLARLTTGSADVSSANAPAHQPAATSAQPSSPSVSPAVSPSPSPSQSPSSFPHSDSCLLSPDSSPPHFFNPATDRLIVHPQWREGYTFFLRPPRITPSCFRPLRHPPP